MPQAIAALLVTAIGLTGTAAAIASALVTIAVAAGLSFIANQIFGSGGVGRPSDGQRVVRVNVGSRVRHYGRVRVGGQLTFYESREGTLYSLVTTGQGRLSGIVEYLLNGQVVSVNGSGLVTDAKFNGAISIHHRLGTDNSTAYSQLTSVFSEWTSNHRQRGCSSLLVISRGVDQEEFSQVYEGNREPEPSVTIDSSLVYDPRKDSTQQIAADGTMGSGSHRKDDPTTFEYSDDWSLCFADYLAHPDGYGMGWNAINWENVAQEADISEATVSTVDARTIARWRAAGSYRLADDDRNTVLKEFLKAADGFIWQDENGLANIRCGRWIAPTVSIPEKHILSVTAQLGPDATDRANEVRVIYMEPQADYTEVEADPTVDATAQAALGRAEVARFDAYYCPDHNQAKRIGKRLLARLGERWQLTIKTNLYGLNAIGQRFIYVTISELSITNVAFEVSALQIDPGDEQRAPTVTLGLLEVEEDDFAFDAATEEGTPPNGRPDTVVAITVETMTNTALEQIDVTGGVVFRATWDEPTRVGLLAQVQFRESPDGDWLEMAVSQGAQTATSPVLLSGTEYDVRGRFLTISGRPGEWVDSGAITPSLDTTAPTITSSATVSVEENATLAHSLTADESVTWSIVGGVDQDEFEISGSTLRWASDGTQDFETPADDDADNDYEVQVQAEDAAGNTSTQSITVSVTDVTETDYYADLTITQSTAHGEKLPPADLRLCRTASNSSSRGYAELAVDNGTWRVTGTLADYDGAIAGITTRRLRIADGFSGGTISALGAFTEDVVITGGLLRILPIGDDEGARINGIAFEKIA